MIFCNNPPGCVISIVLTLRFVDPFMQGQFRGLGPRGCGATGKDDDIRAPPLVSTAGPPGPRGAETRQPGSQVPQRLAPKP